jgi:hypothetical protein
MAQKKRRDAGDSAPSAPDFDPVKLRYRRDGFTPERQVAIITALAECGCVVEACRRVGISTEAFYELVRQPDAQSFRLAVDIAMDNAVRRIDDAMREAHGLPRAFVRDIPVARDDEDEEDARGPLPDEEDFEQDGDLGEERLPPDVPSTSSTSAPARNRAARRRAAARGRKR